MVIFLLLKNLTLCYEETNKGYTMAEGASKTIDNLGDAYEKYAKNAALYDTSFVVDAPTVTRQAQKDLNIPREASHLASLLNFYETNHSIAAFTPPEGFSDYTRTNILFSRSLNLEKLEQLEMRVEALEKKGSYEETFLFSKENSQTLLEIIKHLLQLLEKLIKMALEISHAIMGTKKG